MPMWVMSTIYFQKYSRLIFTEIGTNAHLLIFYLKFRHTSQLYLLSNLIKGNNTFS